MKYKQGKHPNSRRNGFKSGHPYIGTKRTWFKKGHKLSEETKRKMGLARRGKPHPKKTGRSALPEVRASQGKKREKHWNWQGGLSLTNDRHDSHTYKEWRMAVYKRDNFTCVHCGKRKLRSNGLVLHADHILAWATYPEQRYEVSNGRTLCYFCHVSTPNWGVKIGKGVVSYGATV